MLFIKATLYILVHLYWSVLIQRHFLVITLQKRLTGDRRPIPSIIPLLDILNVPKNTNSADQ